MTPKTARRLAHDAGYVLRWVPSIGLYELLPVDTTLSADAAYLSRAAIQRCSAESFKRVFLPQGKRHE